MRTGHYLVACPALNEREEVSDCYTAADICYAMHQESGAYAYVEDYLGHTYMEYGGMRVTLSELVYTWALRRLGVYN